MKDKDLQKGFTLIEMIVSVGIFSVVMLVGITALLSVIDLNKKNQSLKVAVNNINLAMENMSRDIRTGTDYHCSTTGDITLPRDCSSGADLIAFEGVGGDNSTFADQIVYRLSGEKIQRSSNGGEDFFDITAGDITVTDLMFYVQGSEFGDGLQPRVALVVAGSGGSGNSAFDFNLQTTISQRNLDL